MPIDIREMLALSLYAKTAHSIPPDWTQRSVVTAQVGGMKEQHSIGVAVAYILATPVRSTAEAVVQPCLRGDHACRCRRASLCVNCRHGTARRSLPESQQGALSYMSTDRLVAIAIGRRVNGERHQEARHVDRLPGRHEAPRAIQIMEAGANKTPAAIWTSLLCGGEPGQGTADRVAFPQPIHCGLRAVPSN
jgi:hypothetical protein